MWWRRALPWLFALALAANVFEIASLTILPWNGATGVETVPTARPFMQRVVAVGVPARRAGIAVGDVIDTREQLYGNHFATPVVGKPFVYLLHRGDRTIQATVVPTQAPVGWDQITRLICVFWVLAFALLVMVKGAKNRDNDYIALILISLALASPPSRTALPDMRVLASYANVAVLAIVVLTLSLAFYGTNVGKPLSRSRRALLASSIAFIALTGFAFAVGNLLGIFPVADPAGNMFTVLNCLAIGPTYILSLSGIVAAIPQAPLEERQRLAWVVAGFVPYVVFDTIGNAVYEASFLGGGAIVSALNVSIFFVPAALTYAALSRKLFDIGFVLNRAAVFTGVSAVVVGAFVLLEWALGQWFEGESHATSLAINGGLALVIGVSFRLIHGYVDRAVDTIFFRKRHENETALRRFARETAFFTSESALLERAHTIILEHSEASSVRTLFSADLDANDPAVVAMKAWQEAVDLTTRETTIDGDVAFPMLAHGSLIGAIVCGAKVNGEHYAPDEMDTLQTVAHGVGLALEGLTRSEHQRTDVLMLMSQNLEAIARHLGVDEAITPAEPWT
jgi:hypothetical protein